MAKKPKGRVINGILLLDKPIGMSSNKVLQIVKRLFHAQKAGHTGALDPLATGLLPICLGQATKFSQYLLDSDKTYVVTAQLGVRTNTSDAEGDVVSVRPVSVTLAQLAQAINYFYGETDQIPSLFSALKYQGKPLYEYARAGISIPRVSRKINVYQIKLLERSGDFITLLIHCSKGTYIRTIIDDLGEMLGCGAHVTALRRTGVAHYPAEKMVSLDILESLLEQAKIESTDPSIFLDPFLLPMDSAVQHLLAVQVDDDQQKALQFGQAISHEQSQFIVKESMNDGFRLVNQNSGEFFGIGQINGQGLVAPKRLV